MFMAGMTAHKMINIDALESNADWPKRTKDSLAEIKALRERMRTLGLRVAKKTGRVRSAKIRYDVTNEDAADWARKHAAKLAKGLSKTTRKNIREAIALGFEGVDFETVVAGVMEMVGDEARAKLIARTESMAAVSAGQRQAWARDVEEGWLTGRERRVWIAVPGACPLCEELDGTTARLDGTYKGDIEGPPLHPRCRCTEGLS